MALVVWASAVFAGIESVRKLLSDQGTSHVGAGIAAAAVGIIGNQVVARYKLRVGRRIQSATLISDAKHSWLDALSSAGALAGLIGVAFGQRWADPVAGLIVTVFICHVGYEVTTDIARRLLDGVDDDVVITAERIRRGRGDTPCPRTGTLDRTHPARRDRRPGGSRSVRRSSRPARRSARPGRP